ncbi:MAG: beta-phosphoglucomutase family hydrolase [Candidatus Microthrix parvicella]|uniref:HAD family hydrolase n=1 Tax=Candidatus Neomicrothrix parvicella TaxID=41950 RepID=UPI00058964A0|nr:MULTISPECIES: beta-phosphoglucomutase family hydrolase [Microthrix]MBK7021940.1 beta-phosphoglucomutase family hydrolase [Candidatus Microthrix sp.]
MDWSPFAAVLFDLDGVITPTADVHRRAWTDMFNGFLAGLDGQQPFTDDDYVKFVDGKPRADGVRSFLSSRSIDLPDGDADDPAAAHTVAGLGTRKNDRFNEILQRDGVDAYPGSIALLDALKPAGLRLAIVSSSRNARAVLSAAGLLDRFEVIVDGNVGAEAHLDGKPAPDYFLHAAAALNAAPEHAVVLEDAISGVQAGAAGTFGLVIGVDRGAGHNALVNAGAHQVVSDLDELLPAGDADPTQMQGTP